LKGDKIKNEIKKNFDNCSNFCFLFGVLPLTAIHPSRGYVTDTVPGGSITYYSRGNVSIDISSLNFRFGNGYLVPKMSIQATTYEASTLDPTDHATLMLQIQINDAGVFVPLGIFSTSPETIPFLQNAFKGLPVYKTGPPVLNNIRLVGNSELQVERHGNSISVNFNPESTTTLYMSAATYPNPSTTKPLIIPAFHIDFNKNGGSMHNDFYQTTLRPYSGYVVHYSFTGFNADASFTSATWGLKNVAGSSAFITMHGIQTWIPGPIGPA
jgi:hypothetical protein